MSESENASTPNESGVKALLEVVYTMILVMLPVVVPLAAILLLLKAIVWVLS